MCGGALFDHLIRPLQERRPHRQTYRRRGFFVLAFDVRLIAGFEGRGGVASYFLTSTTTSCHQCSTGPLSSPSICPRVTANCRSWCHASQAARVFHVPTITRLSGLSYCRRSSPPTLPGRFFAADRRLRIAASHSRPAPSFRCTCVTIVIIELVLHGPKSSPVRGFHSITSSARSRSGSGASGRIRAMEYRVDRLLETSHATRQDREHPPDQVWGLIQQAPEVGAIDGQQPKVRRRHDRR